jgi:L-ribulose-5-phosphate 4-epimerase
MYKKQKREIIKAGIVLDRYGLIALSGGNVSMRSKTGEILITPSGMIYEDMVEEDIIVMGQNGEIIEGDRKPSSDVKGILYVFEKRQDVNAVIHTHQPYTTAISLIADEFRADLTTLANVAGGNVKVTRYSSPGSVEMGKDTVKYLGDSSAVILAHHGVITIGETLKSALYTAVYMEEAAKGYLAAKACGEINKLTDKQIKQASEVFKYCGQGTADMPEGLSDRI